MARFSIFYLDDEQRLLDIFQEMFGDIYEVRTTTSLTEAHRSLSECPADIIISDHGMPNIEGREFLREAALMCPGSFRIMTSGQVTVGDMIEEISAGIIQLFVAKPWKERHMLQVLERASAMLNYQPPASSIH